MQRDRMRRTLHHLGIKPSNYKVLKLLPLVYVAWASGGISLDQEERLVELARDYFQVGEQGEQILRGWISQKPDASYFEEGLHDIFLLAHAGDEWGFDVDELQGLLLHAEAIARVSGEVLDAPTSVSETERHALAHVARELGVQDGESWAVLMRELKSRTGG